MSKEKLNTLDGLSVNGTGDIFTNKQHTLQIEHRKPEEYKVHIWGYELCNGAEWQDFLDVANKLGKEKAELENELELTEKALELACNKIGDMFGSNYQEAWFFADVGNSIITREYFEEYFKTKAKEMIKSDLE